jgi:flagellar biosynthesis/type III secretory pathway chaperone
MHAQGMQRQLETVLILEVECTCRLLKCLETERSALTERDTSALALSTEEKLGHTQKLEALEEERERLLAEMGFSGDPADVSTYFEKLPGKTHRLCTLWQQILTNIEACRTSNLMNGRILDVSRQHVEQALCLLRGEAGSPSLYDTKGGTAPHVSQRELGKV